mgnify:CR=1 FL=1
MGTRTTYAVQWKIDGKTNWAYYSNWKPEPQTAINLMELAKQYSGCSDARILKRTETLEVYRPEIEINPAEMEAFKE